MSPTWSSMGPPTTTSSKRPTKCSCPPRLQKSALAWQQSRSHPGPLRWQQSNLETKEEIPEAGEVTEEAGIIEILTSEMDQGQQAGPEPAQAANVKDTPQTLQRPAVITIIGGPPTLGSAWNPTPAPWPTRPSHALQATRSETVTNSRGKHQKRRLI